MINKKNNILDAWVLIEQLTEGDITTKIKKNMLKKFQSKKVQEELLQLFRKKQLEMTEENFKKSGVVFYFDIFNFNEIIAIFKENFQVSMSKPIEEVAESKKFTFALYFDSQLNFQSDKFFFSISGYIRYKKNIPHDFYKVETLAKNRISEYFENNEFNSTISWLLDSYKVELNNCGYAFLENLENDDVNLHSFFINDLRKAKNLSNENLKRYFEGFHGERKNLDSQNTKETFSEEIFEKVLQPKNYPLGRFPTKPAYKLAFMQQVAVNLALHDSNNIRSVNGPPGTGKTTLLKEIFADLVVQQAYEISKLQNKKLKGSIKAYKKTTLAILPEEISNKNIVIASSNNGAVQNIINDLPRLKGVDKQFQDIDYFRELCDIRVDKELSNEDEKMWGLFSLEGGKSANINKLISKLTKIKNYLSNEYEEDDTIYTQFIKKYDELKNEVGEIQKFSEMLKELRKENIEFENRTFKFEVERKKRNFKLNQEKIRIKREVERNLEQQNRLAESILNISQEISTLKLKKDTIEKKYNLILQQKPKFLTLQKIFKTVKCQKFQLELFEIVSQVKKTENDLRNNINNKENLNLELKNLRTVQFQKMSGLTKKIDEYNKWVTFNEQDLSRKENKIKRVRKEIQQRQIEGINVNLTYEEFQKSNPWFSDDFRRKQSELFIFSLKVREQFLYDNKQHLNSAKNAWINQAENILKEHGPHLLKESWQWINFAIPVIGTTFASFSRMFRCLGENDISNLFIDEAGQALPQASIGAIFRSRKIMAVGDPSQIRPVLTLDSTMLSLIARKYKVDETFISKETSVQSLVDRTSQYGYQKKESEWIGIPLWVHRRCKDPMFSISNEISYNNLMVQGNEGAMGKAKWIDCSGKAYDKFVHEQAKWLRNEIKHRIDNNKKLVDEIYVITPFSNVVKGLIKELEGIDFIKRDKESNKVINVGTVHVFQGKEAKIVYFVLGADFKEKGSANWVVADANMMNVAVTRAKEEFYIVGDKRLYKSLNSSIIDSTVDIIDSNNAN